MKRTLLPFLFAVSSLAAEPEEWTYLDNGSLRLGVNRSAGAAIGWLSESGRDKNVLNHFDLGRYVQQSWYGEPDDSKWNGKPWLWNPVQAGSWQHKPALLQHFSATADVIESVSTPVHWASGKSLEEVVLRQKIQLEKSVVQIAFSMEYSGTVSHPVRDQELPAVFVDAAYETLYISKRGKTELTSLVPGWPNERYDLSQPWVAYLDESGRGIGILVPGVETITCYRAAGDPNNRSKGACSYVAPIRRMEITPGFTFQYQVYLTLGTLPEIQARFAELLKTE
ncbi:MAG TPA: hypothetical protein PK648_04215 [Verrucomicrobiales bacterium]|jgi:hypothetical protein|nr:hypothetical protein [Verrucomicrobiales bacterium]